jgi:hypothetical protein
MGEPKPSALVVTQPNSLHSLLSISKNRVYLDGNFYIIQAGFDEHF